MTAHCAPAYTIPFVIISDAEHVRNILCGMPQHDEHLKSHRWFLYTRDANRRAVERDAILMAEVRKMAADRRERAEMLRQELQKLEAAE